MHAVMYTHMQMHIHTYMYTKHTDMREEEQFLAFPNRSESPKSISSSFPSLSSYS